MREDLPLQEHETISDWSEDRDIPRTLKMIDRNSPERGRCYYYAFKNALRLYDEGYVTRVAHGYYEDARTKGTHAWTEYYDKISREWVIYDEATGVKGWEASKCTKNYKAHPERGHVSYQRIKK